MLGAFARVAADMMNYVWFFLAAVFEIAGCYAFYMWLRLGKSGWWIAPALLSLTPAADPRRGGLRRARLRRLWRHLYRHFAAVAGGGGACPADGQRLARCAAVRDRRHHHRDRTTSAKQLSG